MFRNDRQEANGGVAILLNNNIHAQKESLPDTLKDPSTTPLLISILQQKDPIYIATLYSYPQSDINTSLPFLTYPSKFRNLILAADINCQYDMVGDPKTDGNGKKLFKYLLLLPLININLGTYKVFN